MTTKFLQTQDFHSFFPNFIPVPLFSSLAQDISFFDFLFLHFGFSYSSFSFSEDIVLPYPYTGRHYEYLDNDIPILGGFNRNMRFIETRLDLVHVITFPLIHFDPPTGDILFISI